MIRVGGCNVRLKSMHLFYNLVTCATVLSLLSDSINYPESLKCIVLHEQLTTNNDNKGHCLSQIYGTVLLKIRLLNEFREKMLFVCQTVSVPHFFLFRIKTKCCNE